MNRKISYLSIVLSFLFIIFLNFNVQAKDISISNFDVHSQLLRDGSLYMDEIIDFKMNGEFNGVYREINTKFSGGVENIQVKEIGLSEEKEFKKVEKANNGQEGVYEILKSGDIYNVKIYSPSKDENKKFKISYELKNVAVKYNDIAELQYRFWGDKSDTSIDKFNINLTVDKSAAGNNLKVFTRGPVDAMKASVVDLNSFNIKGENIKAKTPIEGRFLFPKETIALSNNIIKEDGLNKILEEEKLYEKSINEEKQHREYMKSTGNIAAWAALVLNLVLAIIIFKTNKKEEDENFNTFPDECTPAVASKLYNKVVSERDVVATILDLVRKKYLYIKNEDGDNYTIIKDKSEGEDLLSHEKYIIKWFINYIGNGLKVESKDIECYAKEYKSKFFDYFHHWKSLVKEEFNKKGYYDKKSSKIGKILTLIAVIEISVMVIFLTYGSTISIIGLLTGISVVVYSFSLYSKRSPYGETQWRKWKSFKKNLENNEFIKKEDLSSIEYVDKYLVYAIALGVNDRIFKKLNININANSGEDYCNSCIYWYYVLGMNDEHNTIQNSIHNSNSSSNSDSGSSFSSGDGGGCAGGGDAGGF